MSAPKRSHAWLTTAQLLLLVCLAPSGAQEASPPDTSPWVSVIEGGPFEARWAAVGRLKQMGATCLPVARQLLKSQSRQVRLAAVELLASAPAEGIPELGEVFRGDDLVAAQIAYTALARVATPEAFRAIAAEQTRSVFHRALAREVWREPGARDDKFAAVSGTLTAAGTSPEVQCQCLYALRSLDPVKAWPLARGYLGAQDRDVRWAAIACCAGSPDAVTDLEGFLTSTDAALRRHAISSLLEGGSRTAIEACVKELTGPDALPEPDALPLLTALAAAGDIPPSVLPLLARHWSSISERDIKKKLIEAVAKLPAEQAVPTLLMVLDKGLAKYPYPDAIASIERLAARGLCDDRVLAAVADVVIRQRDFAQHDLRKSACLAIAQFAGKDEATRRKLASAELAAALGKCAREGHFGEETAAIQALTAVEGPSNAALTRLWDTLNDWRSSQARPAAFDAAVALLAKEPERLVDFLGSWLVLSDPTSADALYTRVLDLLEKTDTPRAAAYLAMWEPSNNRSPSARVSHLVVKRRDEIIARRGDQKMAEGRREVERLASDPGATSWERSREAAVRATADPVTYLARPDLLSLGTDLRAVDAVGYWVVSSANEQWFEKERVRKAVAFLAAANTARAAVYLVSWAPHFSLKDMKTQALPQLSPAHVAAVPGTILQMATDPAACTVVPARAFAVGRLTPEQAAPVVAILVGIVADGSAATALRCAALAALTRCCDAGRSAPDADVNRRVGEQACSLLANTAAPGELRCEAAKTLATWARAQANSLVLVTAQETLLKAALLQPVDEAMAEAFLGQMGAGYATEQPQRFGALMAQLLRVATDDALPVKVRIAGVRAYSRCYKGESRGAPAAEAERPLLNLALAANTPGPLAEAALAELTPAFVRQQAPSLERTVFDTTTPREVRMATLEAARRLKLPEVSGWLARLAGDTSVADAPLRHGVLNLLAAQPLEGGGAIARGVLARAGASLEERATAAALLWAQTGQFPQGLDEETALCVVAARLQRAGSALRGPGSSPSPPTWPRPGVQLAAPMSRGIDDAYALVAECLDSPYPSVRHLCLGLLAMGGSGGGDLWLPLVTTQQQVQPFGAPPRAGFARGGGGCFVPGFLIRAGAPQAAGTDNRPCYGCTTEQWKQFVGLYGTRMATSLTEQIRDLIDQGNCEKAIYLACSFHPQSQVGLIPGPAVLQQLARLETYEPPGCATQILAGVCGALLKTPAVSQATPAVVAALNHIVGWTSYRTACAAVVTYEANVPTSTEARPGRAELIGGWSMGNMFQNQRMAPMLAARVRLLEALPLIDAQAHPILLAECNLALYVITKVLSVLPQQELERQAQSVQLSYRRDDPETFRKAAQQTVAALSLQRVALQHLDRYAFMCSFLRVAMARPDPGKLPQDSGALLTQAYLSHSQYDYAAALPLYRAAYAKMPAGVHKAVALLGIAAIERDWELNVRSALGHIEEAAKLIAAGGADSDVARVRIAEQRALCFEVMNQPTSALRHYREALATAQHAHVPAEVARTATGLARMCSLTARKVEGLAVLMDAMAALSESRSIGDLQLLARLYGEIARASRDVRNAPEAELAAADDQYDRLAVVLSRAARTIPQVVASLFPLRPIVPSAVTSEMLKAERKAWSGDYFLRIARGFSEMLGDTAAQTELMLSEAGSRAPRSVCMPGDQADWIVFRMAPTVGSIVSALAASHEQGQPRSAWKAHAAVGQLLAGVVGRVRELRAQEGALGNDADDAFVALLARQAARDLADAAELMEAIRSRMPSSQSRAAFMGQDRAGIYYAMARIQLVLGDDGAAVDWAERGKARAFLDMMASKVPPPQDAEHDSTLRERQRLQDEMNQIGLTLAMAGSPQERGDVDRSSETLVARARRYSELLEQVGTESPELDTATTARPLPIAQIQKQLGPGDLILEYLSSPTGEGYPLAWAVTADSLHSRQLALTTGELDERVRRFRSLLARPDGPATSTLASELYQTLAAPFEQQLRAAKIVCIVPHGALHNLPFHALTSDGRFLIERVPVCYAPSANALLTCRAHNPHRKASLTVYANPQLGERATPLKFAAAEAQAIAGDFPDSKLLHGADATESAVAGTASGRDIVHFATHGEMNPWAPLLSCLYLAEDGANDGRLEVHEVFRLKLSASLVTLSACQTALGEVTGGDDITGLVRAFMYAGTPTVLASLWRVDDQATARLMAGFYERLKTKGKATALCETQREAIGQGLHPYYWAPFEVIGDWQ